ncbi:17-beta-hydroxysteroid dehydrogenase 14 isoform X1 [Octopus bimaculoides]|uniref:17-beta-hydroxysteroid dehydrogenase 14 n=1 Tax=Octopus bimaculoides TaxID=37653 RepID=A0A0L8GHD0_OCTBM|nr:17-beta-hydroxysteroid dehydrogenase 14 isoform X1 [Octopus bimaculoides]|eukprot:XP_014781126.1 PREDICTED: 17-beta-hydroxysteroid dehydrogenase 14-like isoform X1 [Octopus bimaculoides]
MASSLRYKDKVVIITGGARGIGKGCVETFVKNGSKVAFCDIHDDEAKPIEEKMNQMGPGEAYYINCNLRDEAQIKNMIDKVVEKYGTIDCLINNAGYHPGYAVIEDVTVECFNELLQVNLIAVFLTCKYALPYIRLAKGNIINIASVVTYLGQKDSIPYTASKGAVASMSKTLAISEAKHGVRVNTISPGAIWTPLWAELKRNAENPEKIYNEGVSSQVMGRMGTPSEISTACLYLAADGTYCTGMDMNVSGGVDISVGSKSEVTPS